MSPPPDGAEWHILGHTYFGDDTVTRIDPRTSRPIGHPIRVGDRPVGIAYGAGHMWVVSLGDGTVTKIAP